MLPVMVSSGITYKAQTHLLFGYMILLCSVVSIENILVSILMPTPSFSS